jgi:predicted  nucleic acid-binding Zn-ribbon protein
MRSSLALLALSALLGVACGYRPVDVESLAITTPPLAAPPRIAAPLFLIRDSARIPQTMTATAPGGPEIVVENLPLLLERDLKTALGALFESVTVVDPSAQVPAGDRLVGLFAVEELSLAQQGGQGGRAALGGGGALSLRAVAARGRDAGVSLRGDGGGGGGARRPPVRRPGVRERVRVGDPPGGRWDRPQRRRGAALREEGLSPRPLPRPPERGHDEPAMPEPKPVVEGDKDQSAAPGPLEALVERLHADLEAVRADLAEEQELRDALSREESALREGLAAARTELAVARADLGAARRELEVTRAESSGLRRELASARAERESARGELELALKELHNSREERAGLGATLAAAQAERAELAGLLASSAAEVQRFKAEEAGLLREFDQAQAAIERLTAALASCEHKLSDETAAHASTRRELARAEEARGEVAKERRRGKARALAASAATAALALLIRRRG